jgi:ParB family chromosome partitioning protein
LKFKNSKKGFTNYFGSKVDVKVGNGKGKITIPFQSEEDFNRIMELIKDSE